MSVSKKMYLVYEMAIQRSWRTLKNIIPQYVLFYSTMYFKPDRLSCFNLCKWSVCNETRTRTVRCERRNIFLITFWLFETKHKRLFTTPETNRKTTYLVTHAVEQLLNTMLLTASCLQPLARQTENGLKSMNVAFSCRQASLCLILRTSLYGNFL